MTALFMSYVHLSIDFWSMDKFFPPSASLLSTEVLLLSMKGDHPKDHTEELAFPQAGCFPPLIWIFLYIWLLLPGLPFFFLSTWKAILNLFCVLAQASLQLEDPPHQIPCPCFVDSYHLPQITTHICFLVRLPPWTVSPLHMSIQNTYTTVPRAVFKRYIHWTNEQNPHGFHKHLAS